MAPQAPLALVLTLLPPPIVPILKLAAELVPPLGAALKLAMVLAPPVAILTELLLAHVEEDARTPKPQEEATLVVELVLFVTRLVA